MSIKRRKTRMVSLGNLGIGYRAPISIQSMTKTDTQDVDSTVKEIKRLQQAGCEIIRVAVKNRAAAKAIKEIKSKINIPLVADIHFHYSLGIESILNGADGIRLNPHNINKPEEVQAVVKMAQKHKVPIRIGVNAGSLKDTSSSIAQEMVNTGQKYVRLLESFHFQNIIISLKASDIYTTLEANRKMAKLCNYPFHLGITASGLPGFGSIKSALGIGALLLEGIGDTIRVSLTGEPIEEVKVAQYILKVLQLRNFGPEIISCPTCGRCEIDLVKITREVEKKLYQLTIPYYQLPFLKVAIMGCIVNGPGEAREADIGVAGGKGSGILFKKGKKIKKIKEKYIVDSLIKEIENLSLQFKFST